MTSMTRHQLRAARALLALQQDVLAHEADVGVASVRRFENGTDVGEDVIEALRAKLVEHGAVLVASGTIVDGREVGGGVVLDRWDDLPIETQRRLKRLDLSPEKASTEIPTFKREGVGRRARSPVPEEAKAKRKPGERRGARRKSQGPSKLPEDPGRAAEGEDRRAHESPSSVGARDVGVARRRTRRADARGSSPPTPTTETS